MLASDSDDINLTFAPPSQPMHRPFRRLEIGILSNLCTVDDLQFAHGTLFKVPIWRAVVGVFCHEIDDVDRLERVAHERSVAARARKHLPAIDQSRASTSRGLLLSVDEGSKSASTIPHLSRSCDKA